MENTWKLFPLPGAGTAMALAAAAAAYGASQATTPLVGLAGMAAALIFAMATIAIELVHASTATCKWPAVVVAIIGAIAIAAAVWALWGVRQELLICCQHGSPSG